MSDILSNLNIRTKVDPSTPRDVLVSYVTRSIANMLHSCAQQGLNPYGGKKPKGGWEDIELDPKHELDYYLSYVVLLVNKLDRSDLIDLFSHCHELAIANPLDVDSATMLLQSCFAGNYLIATYYAENGKTLDMPEPRAGSFCEPSLTSDAGSYRYRITFLGTTQAISTLNILFEDASIGLGVLLGKARMQEFNVGDNARCLSLIGCAPTDLCKAMQDGGLLTVIAEKLQLIIEYRAESIDNQWEAHGLVQGGKVLELTKTPRFYYEFNESATYDDYVKYHTGKKMAMHVWKPRKKTEKQFQAACKNHEVEVLGQFEFPLQFGDNEIPPCDVFPSTDADLSMQDAFQLLVMCMVKYIQANLDEDGRLNTTVPMSQAWNLDWKTLIAQRKLVDTVCDRIVHDGILDPDMFGIIVNRAYSLFILQSSFEPSLALALTCGFAGTIEIAPAQKEAAAPKAEPAPKAEAEAEPAPASVFKPIRMVSPSVNVKAQTRKKAAAATTQTTAAPKVEVPKVEVPKVEVPKVAPKAEAPKEQPAIPHNGQLIARLAPPKGSEIDKALSKAAEPIRVLYAAIMSFVDALPYQILYIARTNHTSCTVVKTNGQEVIFGSVRKPTKTYIAVNLKPGSRGFGYGEGGAELEPRESSPDGLFRNVKGVGFWGNGHLEVRITPDLLENGELPKIVQDAILDAAKAAYES